ASNLAASTVAVATSQVATSSLMRRTRASAVTIADTGRSGAPWEGVSNLGVRGYHLVAARRDTDAVSQPIRRVRRRGLADSSGRGRDDRLLADGPIEDQPISRVLEAIE